MQGELAKKEIIIHAAPKADTIETTRIILLSIWISDAEPWAASAS
jgi:hypothetical protein